MKRRLYDDGILKVREDIKGTPILIIEESSVGMRIYEREDRRINKTDRRKK